MIKFRDLNKQYQVLKPQIDEAVLCVMHDGDFISGARVKKLEERLAEYVGVKHCVTCGNGTDALTLALMAYDIGVGDAVFVPDFTFFASAEAVAALGATPVFVDVDANTYNIDPTSLEREIERVHEEGKYRLKAIVTVDLFGLCADYPAVEPIAKKHGLIVIEDGAQGFGGRIRERRACSFGNIATTSFFPAKPLGCYGDGGAIFTNDDEKAALIRSLCVHGKGTGKYDNVRIGMNSRLDTIQAAILQVKFDAFVKFELDASNTVASWYTERLADKLRTPTLPEGYTSAWAQYTIQLKDKIQRDEVRTSLNERGIPTMIYYPIALHQQKAFSYVPYYGQCAVSERLCDTVLALPMHPYLADENVDNVYEALCAILKS